MTRRNPNPQRTAIERIQRIEADIEKKIDAMLAKLDNMQSTTTLYVILFIASAFVTFVSLAYIL